MGSKSKCAFSKAIIKHMRSFPRLTSTPPHQHFFSSRFPYYIYLIFRFAVAAVINSKLSANMYD